MKGAYRMLDGESGMANAEPSDRGLGMVDDG